MGNSASRVVGCFVPVGNHRDRVGLDFSEPLDEGLGHSFCYVRPVIESSHITPSQSERFSVEPAVLDPETQSTQSRSFRLSQELAVDGTAVQRPNKNIAETTFKSISGASVSANASTTRTVATNDQYSSFANGAHERAAAFESTSSFSSLPLQPVPRGITVQSGPVSGHSNGPALPPLDRGLMSGSAERGFTSGPLERGGFMSGPLERGGFMSGPLENIDRTHFSAPLTYYRKKRSLGHLVRNMGKPMRKVLSRTLSKTSSTLVRTQRSLVTPVMHFVGWQPKEQKYGAKDVDTFYNPKVDMSFMSSEGDYHCQNIQWAQGKAGEDRVHVVLSEEHGWLFVGIYDGFNGPDAPDFLMSNLYRAINKELQGLLWDCEDNDGLSTGNKFRAEDLDCESGSFRENQENADNGSFGGIQDNAKAGSSGQLQESADNGPFEGVQEKAENGSFKVAVQKKGGEQCLHHATLKETSKTDEHKIQEHRQEAQKVEDKESVKQHQDPSRRDGEELVTNGSAVDSASKTGSKCTIKCYTDVTSSGFCEAQAGRNDLSCNPPKALNVSQGDSLGLVQKVDFNSRPEKTAGEGRRGKCLRELLAEEDDSSDSFTWKPTTGILAKCHWDMPHFTEKPASRDVAPTADSVSELDATEEKGSDRFSVNVDIRGGNGAGGQISEHTVKVSFCDLQKKQGTNRSLFGSKQRQTYTKRKVIRKKLFPWKFDWEREQIESDPKLDENLTVDNRKFKANAVDHVAVLKALARALEATEGAYLEMADKVLDENPELALMGSCVLVMLMKDQDVYIMNLGDSRAILAQKRPDMYEPHLNPSRMHQSNFEKGDERERSGVRDSLIRLELEQIIEEPLTDCENIEASQNSKNVEMSAYGVKLSALQLSTDHSTSIEEEVLRIKVEHLDDNQSILNDRVKGQLKVTRAFGAGFLKQPKWNNALLEVFRIDYVGTAPYITCAPSVCHHRLGPNDHFLVLSSDGLYQYLSNEEVVSHVGWFMEKFPDGDPAQSLIEELLFRAAKKNGMDFHELLDIPQGDRRKYHDDVSVMVISLEGRIWKSSG